MAIHDGVVLSQATAMAIARGNCLGGTLGEIVQSRPRPCAYYRCPGGGLTAQICEKLCSSWQLTQQIPNGEHLRGVFSSPPAPLSAMTWDEISAHCRVAVRVVKRNCLLEAREHSPIFL